MTKEEATEEAISILEGSVHGEEKYIKDINLVPGMSKQDREDKIEESNLNIEYLEEIIKALS